MKLLCDIWWPLKRPGLVEREELQLLLKQATANFLVGACVLGDSFGTFTDCVLGQFTGQQESDSSLDLSARDSCSLVVVGQTGSFTSNSLEDVVDEAVHD